MALWNTLPKSLEKREVITFDGGLNQGAPSINVKDNESIDENGWDTDEYPAIHTRRGFDAYGTSGSAQTNLLINFANTHLVRAAGTALQYNSSGTTWTVITGTFTDADWDATNFDISGAALILTNGTDNVKYWNGTTLANLNATDAPKGKHITNDTVRVWIAKDDIVYFSAFLDATDWTTAEDSGSVEYYTPNGGDITALREFQTNKYVWKQSSMGVILGTDYFNFRLMTVSDQIGCVSFKTVQEVSTPYGSTLFWLGQNDVYINPANPSPIGQPIRAILDSLNTAQLSRCVGGTDGLRYFLGLVTGANTQPDMFLMYDPRYRKWRQVSEDDNFRYSALLNNVWYMGDSSGQTFKMQQGTDDDGTAIAWSLTTKDFDEGMPEAEKEYYELHVQLYAPSGTTFTLQVSTDQGANYTSVGEAITTSSAIQNTNVIIPLDTVALTHWVRFKLSGTGEAKIFSVERYFRIQTVQI